MKIDTRNLNIVIDGFVKEASAKKAKAVLFLGPFRSDEVISFHDMDCKSILAEITR